MINAISTAIAKIVSLLPQRKAPECSTCPVLGQINAKLQRLEKSEAFIIRKLNYLSNKLDLVEVVSLEETDVSELEGKG